MFKWLRRTGQRTKATPRPAPPGGDPLAKLLEGQSTLGRTLGRLLVRVESVESLASDHLASMRADLARLAVPLDDLFAMADLLARLVEQMEAPGTSLLTGDELAAATVASLATQAHGAGPNRRAAELRRALAAALDRLDRYLGSQGVTRVGRVGEPLDAHALRVVDVVDREDLPDGAVASIVRCGFVLGSQVLREGDVIVCRRRAAARPSVEEAAAEKGNGDAVLMGAQDATHGVGN